jgi:hypothetical protein
MSQHSAVLQSHGGRSVKVLMGWDRPLQGFFLVVQDADDPSEYLYSNLNDPALRRWLGLPPTIDHFLNELKMLGVTVPVAMVDQVRADAWGNVGNRHVVYDSEGRIVG